MSIAIEDLVGSLSLNLVVDNNGNVGIGTNAPSSIFEIYNTDTGSGAVNVGGTWNKGIILSGAPNKTWEIGVETNNGSSKALGFFTYENTTPTGTRTLIGYLHGTIYVDSIDFTGQHRSCYDENNVNNSHIGLIVSSSGVYKNISNTSNISPQINESLPYVELTNTPYDKRVFGIISDKEEDGTTREYSQGNFVSVFNKDENDKRLIINSVGEGGIWVCNANSNIFNGDYITSSIVPGYGMKQDDDLLHNYTVAKITCDCDFDNLPEWIPSKTVSHSNIDYKAAFVGCTYHCG